MGISLLDLIQHTQHSTPLFHAFHQGDDLSNWLWGVISNLQATSGYRYLAVTSEDDWRPIELLHTSPGGWSIVLSVSLLFHCSLDNRICCELDYRCKILLYAVCNNSTDYHAVACISYPSHIYISHLLRIPDDCPGLKYWEQMHWAFGCREWIESLAVYDCEEIYLALTLLRLEDVPSQIWQRLTSFEKGLTCTNIFSMCLCLLSDFFSRLHSSHTDCEREFPTLYM